jgi:hypothetical protein
MLKECLAIGYCEVRYISHEGTELQGVETGVIFEMLYQ